MNKFFSFCVALFLLSFSSFSKEQIDGIVAVVGDSVILKSELDAFVFLKLNETEEKPDALLMNILRNNTLDEMIDGKVMLVYAEKDTNIKVTRAEIDAELEGRVNFIMKKNNLTTEQLDEILMKEQGITLSKFKNEIRNQIRQELIQQRMQQFYISSENLSNSQITSFFEEYRDSIPTAGKSILLQEISFNLTASKEVREAAYAKISKIKELLDRGEDFAETAKKFSEDPGAESGGDLGFVTKGSISELAFEEKIFSLKPGEISEPFETRLGFHIVNVVARRGQSVHARQIFAAVAPDESKRVSVTAQLDSLRLTISTEKDFTAAVNSISNDEMLKSRNGFLSWKSVSQLEPEIASSFSEINENALSTVVSTDKSISLYRIHSINPDRKLTLADDWNTIASIASRIHEQKKMMEIVSRWKQKIYIDKRL